jgi:hypothetical protein
VTFGKFVLFAKVDAVARFRTEPGVAVCRGVHARRCRPLSGKLSGSDGLDGRLLQFFGGAGMESWQVTDVVF